MKVHGYTGDDGPLPELRKKLRRLILKSAEGYVVLMIKDGLVILDHGGSTEQYETATAALGALLMQALADAYGKEGEGNTAH